MLKKFDVVRLKSEFHGLVAGTVGAVMEVYEDGRLCEVEFVGSEGHTLGQVVLRDSDLEVVPAGQI